MMGKSTFPPEVFISYARKDKEIVQELEKHLGDLRRPKLITTWSELDISTGSDWEGEIDAHLETAQIILLLISPEFLASDYCYSREMQQALERHRRGEARVIPIILRPVYWQREPFAKLESLPRGGKAITEWPDRDKAFSEVVKGILSVVEKLSPSEFPEFEPTFSSRELSPTIVPPPLVRIEAPSRSSAWVSNVRPVLGKLLLLIERYSAALNSYEEALRAQPNDPSLHLGKGEALLGLRRTNEALAAYQEAIRLAPDLSAAYEGQGRAYERLAQETYEHLQQQAQSCYERAKQLRMR